MEDNIARLAGELREMGAEYGLCAPWQQMLEKVGDKRALVEMYLQGIDFCLAYDYPGIDYMEKHFKGMCEPMGVFVSEPVQAQGMRKVVAVGKCTGLAEYEGIQVARVFVKHDSRLSVIASGQSIVTVDCFDRAQVDVLAKQSATVTVYRYGNATVNVHGGEVSIIDKHTATYE